MAPLAQAQALTYKPEKGAKLRVLRWKRFVAGDEDAFMANIKKFTEKTGVEVRVDNEGWEDVRPKAAVAANVGSGPDIIIGWFDDPHQYPDKLVDVTDVANYLGGKYGGWYDVCTQVRQRTGTTSGSRSRWGIIGNAIVYRESHVKAAGFDGIPKDTAGFLKLCQALKAKGTPPGFALGKAVGRRQQLGALAALVARRQAGGRERQRRDQLARDHRRARIRRSSSTRPSCPARCAGSTRTTTRPSSTARSR